MYKYVNGSIEISSVRLLGGIGGYLYFIYNLDQEVGSELYRISVDVGITDVENQDDLAVDISIVQNGKLIEIQTEESSLIDVLIYNLYGQRVYVNKVMSNQGFSIDLISGTYFVKVNSNGKICTQTISIVE